MSTLPNAFASGTVLGLAILMASTSNAYAVSPTYEAALEKACPVMVAWQKAHPDPVNDPQMIGNGIGAANKTLRSELLHLYNADEKVDEAWGEQINRKHPDPKVLADLTASRAKNLTAIKAIIAKYGFPTEKMVGIGGVWAAFTLVQHADKDPAFQRTVLRQVENRFKHHAVPGQIYAYLDDRVQVAEEHKQVFGTQFHLVDDTLVLRPVENPSRLEDRRKNAGLFSMKAYACYVHFRSGKRVAF